MIACLLQSIRRFPGGCSYDFKGRTDLDCQNLGEAKINLKKFEEKCNKTRGFVVNVVEGKINGKGR